MSFSVYQCDICLKNKSVRLIPLVKPEKLLVLKLIKIIKRTLRSPKLVYKNYFRRPYAFSCDLQIFFLKLNGKMQESDLSGKKEEVKDTSEKPKVEEICLNDYSCNCINCQNKYGSLPLLLQVIEQKSQREKTEDIPEPEPQPSTSSQDPEPQIPKKVLVCQYCSKSFTHKGDYNKHLRKHTKEQPFSCPICKRKFAHTSNLQRHCRLHSGQKPFVCKTCDKRFSRKDKLECHKSSKFCRSATKKD